MKKYALNDSTDEIITFYRIILEQRLCYSLKEVSSNGPRTDVMPIKTPDNNLSYIW